MRAGIPLRCGIICEATCICANCPGCTAGLAWKECLHAQWRYPRHLDNGFLQSIRCDTMQTTNQRPHHMSCMPTWYIGCGGYIADGTTVGSSCICG
eukprot:221475-Chlamydomonas_euryale.AAC.14